MPRKLTSLSIFVTLLLLYISTPLAAQTFSALWKQAAAAENADLPQDEIAVLEQIEEKAGKDKEYGHLLKATLRRIAVETQVQPDKFAAMIADYSKSAEAANDAALQAVYYATLGHIYSNYSPEGDCQDPGFKDNKAAAGEYYAKALANPVLLSKTKARTYEPLAESGNTSLIFGDDLLHLIAFEAEDYQTMIDYYSSVGNRSAACLASVYKIRGEKEKYEEREDPKKSEYLARVDSLIHEYRDLDVAGEAAIEHFYVMDSSPDVSSEEKVEYIDNALLRWSTWPRMAILRNARQRITLPSFHVTLPETHTIPGKEIPVYLTSVINLQSITMNVYRVDITGDEEYNPNNADDYKALSLLMSDKPVATDSRVWYGLPEYREIRDTLTLAPLPVGVYMAEFLTDNSTVPAERVMLNISGLRVIALNLNDNQMRLIAVNAITGKPVPGADIHIKFRGYDSRRLVEDETILTTESDGEVMYTSTLSPYKYRVTAAGDKAFAWESISRKTWDSSSVEEEKTDTVARIYTDRSVYRPGQTVQMSAIVFRTYTQEHWEAAEGEKVRIVLSGANNKTISETTVETDEWGTATASFTLPSDATAGRYRLQALAGSTVLKSYSFRVEEYKRPTFAVEIDEFKEPYKADDTIMVRGWAKTYSGVPVGNAKVKYTIKTCEFSWWRRFFPNYSEAIDMDETIAGSDGSFYVNVPVKFPSGTKKGTRFARVVLSVEVTSMAGETHAAESVYPISDKATLLDVDGFGQEQCREYVKPFSFVYLNNSGNTINGDVAYTVDGGNPSTAPANKPLNLPVERLSSGVHILRASCQNDTIEKKFVVFSLKDKTVPIDTAAWYYSTCGENEGYPGKRYQMKEGQAEYIHFGTSREDQTVYYAVLSANELLESGQLTLNNEAVCRKMEYKEEWGDGVAISYVWVSDGQCYVYRDSLSRPVKDCSLQVELNTFRDKLTPGEKEEWTVTVKKPDGTPSKAQVMAVLYDQSLDAVCSHNWSLSHTPYYAGPTVSQTAAYSWKEKQLYGEQTVRYASEPDLLPWHFVFPHFYAGYDAYYALNKKVVGSRAAAPLLTASLAEDAGDVETYDLYEEPAEANSETGKQTALVVRENLNETAFFMPQITTGGDGSAQIKFTLPESLTTWRFMSVAHDKEMNAGSMEREMTAHKTLMVQPYMPRFIREGDKARLSATIANMSGETLSVEAAIKIVDPETETTVYEVRRQCEVKAEDNTAIYIDLPDDLSENVYTCIVTAQAGNVSDGERNSLPVLSNNVATVSTRAFTQTAPGEMTIDLAPLYGDNSFNETLTADYTDNPAWLMLEALPAVSEPDADNAISLATALYANGLTEKITEQLPGDSVFAGWKSPVAADELAVRLGKLQNGDGSFSWFGGMTPSDYVTLVVAQTLVRGSRMGLPMARDGVLSRTMDYLDKKISDYIKQLKEKKDEKSLPSEFALHYLYIQTMYGGNIESVARENADYLLSRIKGHSADLTIYGKACMAIILASHPVAVDKEDAEILLESIRQYSLYDEEMGRYFDTPASRYSWCSYKIPTQTMAIEAFQTLVPDDTEMIRGLQQWLLQEKRTQQWDTPVSTADAVYAFFNGWNEFKNGTLDETASPERIAPARLYIDEKEIERSNKTTGSGRTSKTLQGRYSRFTVRKTSGNVSWGAVSVNCMQPLEDATSGGEALSVKREIVDEDGNVFNSCLSVGQKVKVRITIDAGRDLDFVEIADNRPACFEPVEQLTGYYRGAYISTLDNKTVYCYDKFRKGRHVVETEYYIDRAGQYRAGLATVKCTYAPEYQACGASYTIEVK